MAGKSKLPPKLQAWVDARRKFRLSHAEVRMARELGMNPAKLGGLANHRQEKWKAPLPQFIADLYFERFGKEHPEEVLAVEELVARKKRKALEKKDGRDSNPENLTDDPF